MAGVLSNTGKKKSKSHRAKLRNSKLCPILQHDGEKKAYWNML